MRKALAIATFGVAGAGAIGVGAALSFNGSDTLGDFTAELITTQNIAQTQTITGAPFCQFLDGGTFVAADGAVNPYSAALGGSLVYLGGGSGTGENQMAAGAQGIAPMSKFLTKSSCAGVKNGVVEPGVTDASVPDATPLASGIIVAVDGLSIVSASVTGGTTACNGNPADTACTGEKDAGLGFNTTISYTNPDGTAGTYTFLVWQDVLKALYFGTLNPTAPAAVSALGCANPIRVALANNWGKVFENPGCQGSGNALGIPACTQIQHLFRRDDASGTSDIFSSLLGASGPNTTGNIVISSPVAIGVLTVDGGNTPSQYGMGTDSFCNDFQNQKGAYKAAVIPGLNPPNLLTGTALPNAPADAGYNVGLVPNDHQDYDPIRRPCQGNGKSLGSATIPNPAEQVCDRGTFDIANTTVIPIDGGVTYNCGANDAGVCPGNEICYTPGSTGTPNQSQNGEPSGQCWGSVDLAATQLPAGGGASCGAGGSTGSCPFTEKCLLTDGGVPGSGVPGFCWSKANQGSLGLLLPVPDSTILETQPDPNFPGINLEYQVTESPNPNPGQINPCGASIVAVKPPFVVKYSATGIASRTNGLCPNGDLSAPAGGFCFVPGDANNSPNCLTLPGSPAISQVQCVVNGPNPGPNGGGQGSPDGTSCTGYGPDPGNIDPRVFNLYAYRMTSSGNFVFANDDSRRPLFGGAYFRIHTSQDMMIPNTASFLGAGTNPNSCLQGPGSSASVACPIVCAQADMTDQIGCLVQASPCSLGYAGRHSEQFPISVGGTTGPTSGTQMAAIGLRSLGIPDQPVCIQSFVGAGTIGCTGGPSCAPGSPYYPIARKLYFNSLPGYANASVPEQALAQCENTSNLVNQTVLQNFFLPLPNFLADGGLAPNGNASGNANGTLALAGAQPFCEEFNENMLCAQFPFTPGMTIPTTGCQGTFAAGLGGNVATVCGNGVVDVYEDCDFGTLGVDSSGNVIIPTDGGLVNGQTKLGDGGVIFPGLGCSTICRTQ